MRGPAPKPAHLRQRTNKKAGAIQALEAPDVVEVPPIPNPDGREWHVLTVESWQKAWASPMASQWLDTDADALGRLALLWDQFYKEPKAAVMAEIRLQEQRFGFSPLDRSRLQWEIKRAEKEPGKPAESKRRAPVNDPRRMLQAVK